MADELPNVEIGNPAPEPVEVSAKPPTAETVNAFRSGADEVLPTPLRGVVPASEIMFPEKGVLLLRLAARDGVVKPMLHRPESQQALHEVARRIFGQNLLIRIEVGETIAAPVVMDSSFDEEEETGDEPPRVESLRATPQVIAPRDETLTFQDALTRFPDFRDAIELVRKHCGVDPVLFNGQRIKP